MATPDDAPITSPTDFVGAWIQEIETASEEEREWRADADIAVAAYRGDETSKVTNFNIYHSNVETLTPALYNSTPIPDVRQRYGDDDPVAKAVGDMLERALSLTADQYDFDGTMFDSVKDLAIVSRGVVRVRYEAKLSEDGQSVVYEQVNCEHVQWASFRRGPAKNWNQVQWVAFEHYLTKEEIGSKATPEITEEVPYLYSPATKGDDDNLNVDLPRFGACAKVWEVWDKRTREVFFFCPDYSKSILWSTPDPLKLEQFYPIPRPLQSLRTTDSLIPITGLSIYEGLVQELNELTFRIRRLVKQLRPRGGYAGRSDDIKTISEADDGEIVPLTGMEHLVAEGVGLDKAITWFPLEATVAALAQLVQQRELVKSIIYEVTKIADIMRGATNPHETLGAQQLKSQWGSLSIQRQQAEVARFARDLFRLKAEVMANKFSMQSLMMMTGIKLPTQQDKEMIQMHYQQLAQQMAAPQGLPGAAPGGPPPPPPAPPPQPTPEEQKILSTPSVEEVEAMLRQDAMRAFHIDIETDSTVRGDLAQTQQQMTMFLQGIAQMVQSFGPMVERGVMPPDIALDLMTAFARQFKLGKQAEDTLKRWGDKARAMASQPQPPKPDPAQIEMQKGQMELEAVKAQSQADQQKVAMEAQAGQAEHQMAMAKMQAEQQMEQQRLAHEQGRLQMDGQRFQMDMAMQRQRMMGQLPGGIVPQNPNGPPR